MFFELQFYAVLIALFLVLLFAVLVFSYSGFWLLRNWLSPTTRVRAKVLRKWHKNWDVSIVGDTPETSLARLGTLGRHRRRAGKALTRLAGMQDVPEITLAQGTDCRIAFLANGRELEFVVPMETYIECDEGLEGLLVYKGERFNHFIAGVS